jgi:hypothetical protein
LQEILSINLQPPAAVVVQILRAARREDMTSHGTAVAAHIAAKKTVVHSPQPNMASEVTIKREEMTMAAIDLAGSPTDDELMTTITAAETSGEADRRTGRAERNPIVRAETAERSREAEEVTVSGATRAEAVTAVSRAIARGRRVTGGGVGRPAVGTASRRDRVTAATIAIVTEEDLVGRRRKLSRKG